jgi:exonuclease III
MKVCVKSCKESWKYVGMFIVSYEVVQIDVIANQEIKVEKHLLSEVELESGKTYNCTFAKNGNYSWVAEAKEEA